MNTDRVRGTYRRVRPYLAPALSVVAAVLLYAGTETWGAVWPGLSGAATVAALILGWRYRQERPGGWWSWLGFLWACGLLLLLGAAAVVSGLAGEFEDFAAAFDSVNAQIARLPGVLDRLDVAVPIAAAGAVAALGGIGVLVPLGRSRRARLMGVRGKGKTQRTVFLSVDARHALADYLDEERSFDATPESTALFLSAASIKSRRPDGRLSGRSINTILGRIGRLHDAEHTEPERRISPLRPHDLRHTFAFQLAQATNADPYELERRLGHRSQRYIARYTNPPEHVAASNVEGM